ncbi:MAG: lipocalin family protein [Bacteroidota bacterium]|nr:lipocalin family protein [Bacteroidota bacterium]
MASILTASTTVDTVDLNKYSGKWYVIGLLPTSYDKNWDYTTETYTLNKKGDYDIYTTYRKNGKDKSVRSKGFINENSGNKKWKVQFVWPFRADYEIIELGQDYSYTVVGHPQKKFLYIMSRTSKMDDSLYNAIVKRCAENGYETAKMRKQAQE